MKPVPQKPTCGHPEAKYKAKGMCHNCYRKKWLAQQPKKKRALAFRRWELKALYGLDEEQYRELQTIKPGLCHLCELPVEKLNIDHDHSTGVVRGLLCHKCNIALGYYDLLVDNPNLPGYLANNFSQGKPGANRR